MTAKLQIFDLAQRLATTNSRATERVLVKKMIVGLWRVLPVDDRRQFLCRADAHYPHEFIEFHKRFPDRDDEELEIVARHWGYIQPTLYGKDADFGRSFERLIRFRRNPSDKQAEWAKRLYADWKAFQSNDTYDLEVTE